MLRRSTPGGGRASSQTLLITGLLAPPFRGPIIAAGAALIASLAIDIHADLPQLCIGNDLPFNAIVANIQFVTATREPGSLALAWLIMLIAMMTPLIALPLAHVRASSLVLRQWRASAGFLVGYFGIWALAGIPLVTLALTLRLLAGNAWMAFLMACFLALIWSASPLQMAAQNRAHRLRRIGLFGFAADRDCIAFGAALGGWCLASCWAWMLVPLYVSTGHMPAMLAVGAIVMGERLQGPGAPRWRIPFVLLLPVTWVRRAVARDRRERGTGYV